MEYRVFKRDEMIKIKDNLPYKSLQYIELKTILNYWQFDEQVFAWEEDIYYMTSVILAENCKVYSIMGELRHELLRT
jgi:hypothetical protein